MASKKKIHVIQQKNQEEMTDSSSTQDRQRVSLKDFAVLGTLATVTASGLVTLIFGYDNLLEKCKTEEVTYVLATLVLFASSICLLTYILLRMTAHYLVYVGVGVLLAIIYPCHPSRVKRYLQKIFDRAKERKNL